MKQELKNKWIDALLSGKYVQGTGHFRSEVEGRECFCALGVLCDVFDPNKWQNVNELNREAFWFWNERRGILTDPLKEEMGLSPVDHAAIHDMNDSGKSFKEIADWIRLNVY